MRLIDTDTSPAPLPAPPSARFPISRHTPGCFGGEQTLNITPNTCVNLSPTHGTESWARTELWEAAKRNSGDSLDRGQLTSHQSKPGWVRLLEAALIKRINCVMQRLEVVPKPGEGLLNLLPPVQIPPGFPSAGAHPNLASLTRAQGGFVDFPASPGHIRAGTELGLSRARESGLLPCEGAFPGERVSGAA